jgi:hypothetical protein
MLHLKAVFLASQLENGLYGCIGICCQVTAFSGSWVLSSELLVVYLASDVYARMPCFTRLAVPNVSFGYMPFLLTICPTLGRLVVESSTRPASMLTQ